ncbi:uncharacterized protein LOC116615103 [Nematostella vectensis]|uniref:uncharacterized protein LOC116615103 n=1 Tax=Nematostella vectensis TaxID=45351 RepID=UPI00207747F9|nr:uncharacterized protein LOC116615103 [Nematostella vectensis]
MSKIFEEHEFSVGDAGKEFICATSKAYEELIRNVVDQSQGSYGKLKPSIAMFESSMLGLVSSSLPGKYNSSALDDILANFAMTRDPVPGIGNCFYNTVSHGLITTVFPNITSSSDIGKHLSSLGLHGEQGMYDMAFKLRLLNVNEWLNDLEPYRLFLLNGESLEDQANAFLNDGYFNAAIGNIMVPGMANILKMPIVLLSQMQNFPVVPVSPTKGTVISTPLYLAFDQSGLGHYDAIAMRSEQPETDESKFDNSASQKANGANSAGSCRCGQGAKKKEKDLRSCHSFKSRCKCFQSVKRYSDCDCLGCENPYGKKMQRDHSKVTLTRKRMATRMTTEMVAGKKFAQKLDGTGNIAHGWTLFEELIVIQILQMQLAKGGIDIDCIYQHFLQLVSCNVNPKSIAQISSKVMSLISDDRVFRTKLKEQARMNWFGH